MDIPKFLKTSNFFIVGCLCILIGCGDDPEPRNALEVEANESLEDYLTRENFSGSVLVVDAGEVLLNRGFKQADRNAVIGNDSDTIFRLASLTKQFTAMGIMILQERGFLSINDSVSQHITDFPNGDRIQIRHLLTHTSGLIRDYHIEPPSSPVTPEQLVELFKDAPLKFEPGSQYSYSNSRYKLLGLIIERVSGQAYGEFIRAEIFDPLNMSNSGMSVDFMPGELAIGYVGSTATELQNPSLNYSGGGLVSTVNDLYLWDQSFYNNSLVTEESKKAIFTPSLEGYGFGWGIRESDGIATYSHGGALIGFSTVIARTPIQGRLIVLLSNEHQFPVFGVANNLVSILDRESQIFRKKSLSSNASSLL